MAEKKQSIEELKKRHEKAGQVANLATNLKEFSLGRSSGQRQRETVMTRVLDGQFVENLAAETRSSTSLALVSDPELEADSQHAISALRSATAGISVQVKNSQMVSGYKLLYDIRGNPALVLQTEVPRDCFSKG